MKIGHILFPIDFSECSRALNSEVEWLASHFDSRVTLLHAFEIPTSWYGGGEAPLITAEDILAYKESAKRRLKEYAVQVPEARIQRIFAEGAAASHIANWAAERDVDLIVMGTHGYGVVRKLLLGSVAMKVLHDVTCPVWTHSVHGGGVRIDRISNVLCAVELTEEAVPLLRFAKMFAANLDANVRLVHTIPETVYRYFDSGLHRRLMSVAEREISKLQKQAGTNFPLRLTEKDIANDTADLAVESKADLIVIGRGKAHSTLGDLRTHAYAIVRRAPCPVISYSMDWQERDHVRKNRGKARNRQSRGDANKTTRKGRWIRWALVGGTVFGILRALAVVYLEDR
jgi:nucleotide-binding universal stress UspA family protein